MATQHRIQSRFRTATSPMIPVSLACYISFPPRALFFFSLHTRLLKAQRAYKPVYLPKKVGSITFRVLFEERITISVPRKITFWQNGNNCVLNGSPFDFKTDMTDIENQTQL
jgi:hypothetical protein